jgi:hypothetical protein
MLICRSASEGQSRASPVEFSGKPWGALGEYRTSSSALEPLCACAASACSKPWCSLNFRCAADASPSALEAMSTTCCSSRVVMKSMTLAESAVCRLQNVVQSLLHHVGCTCCRSSARAFRYIASMSAKRAPKSRSMLLRRPLYLRSARIRTRLRLMPRSVRHGAYSPRACARCSGLRIISDSITANIVRCISAGINASAVS